MKHIRPTTKMTPRPAMTCPDCVAMKESLGKEGNDPAELCIRKDYCSF